MNWIKSNPFVSALAGITLVLCAALYFLGSMGAKKYEEAKLAFDEASQGVATSESIPLYPTAENRDGKRKALGEYRDSIEALSKLFDAYRVSELESTTPQDFTARLKAANEEVSKAFETAGTEMPEGFLMGFEKYGNEFATEKATGVLEYQLNGLKKALLDLAEARPSALLSVFRENLPEEQGGQYEPAPDDVTRPFGYEISFKGSEESARKFISSLGEIENGYAVVRCLKIVNERDVPPRISDAKFETVQSTIESAPAADNPFGDAFVLPGDDAAEEDGAVAGPAAAEDEPATVEEPAAVQLPATDSSRILAQVLGSEEITVFVRFDLMMFLPSKELPKP